MTILVGHLGLDLRQLGRAVLPERRGPAPLAGVLRRAPPDGRAQREPLPLAPGHRVHRVARPAAGRVRDGRQGAARTDPRPAAATRPSAGPRSSSAGSACSATAPDRCSSSCHPRWSATTPGWTYALGHLPSLPPHGRGVPAPVVAPRRGVRHPRAAPLGLRRHERRQAALRPAGDERPGLRPLARAEPRAPLRRLLLRRRPALVGRPAARVGGRRAPGATATSTTTSSATPRRTRCGCASSSAVTVTRAALAGRPRLAAMPPPPSVVGRRPRVVRRALRRAVRRGPARPRRHAHRLDRRRRALVDPVVRGVRRRPGAADGFPRGHRGRTSSPSCCPRSAGPRRSHRDPGDRGRRRRGHRRAARRGRPAGGARRRRRAHRDRHVGHARPRRGPHRRDRADATRRSSSRHPTSSAGSRGPTRGSRAHAGSASTRRTCVVVEDAVAGLRAARAAGCRGARRRARHDTARRARARGRPRRARPRPPDGLVEGGRVRVDAGIGSAHGCRRRRRGCRARRARRHVRARRCRPIGRAARPGERGQPRRPGVVELRRAVPRRQPRAAPDGHLRLLRPRLAGLGGHRRLGPAHRRPTAAPGPDHWGRTVGPRLRRVGRRREAGLAARARHLVLPRRRVGRARRRHEWGTRELGAALPHPVGHRHRGRRAVRADGCASTSPPVGSSTGRATGSTSSCAPAAPSPGVRGLGARARRLTPGRREQPGRHRRVRVRRPGRRRHARAASAATTTSCAPTGPSGSAPRRPTC